MRPTIAGITPAKAAVQQYQRRQERRDVIWTKTTFGDNEFESIRMGDKVVMKRGAKTGQRRSPNAGGGRRGGFGRGGQAPAAQAEQAIANIQEFTKNGDVYTATLTGDSIRALMPFGRGGRRGGGDAGGNQGPKSPTARPRTRSPSRTASRCESGEPLSAVDEL